MMSKYHNVFPLNKDSAERMFASNDVEKICNALLAIAFHEKDWKWAQDKCLAFFFSDNPDISGLAATCLGHIARIHHQIEKDKVISILRGKLGDRRIAGRIEDAIDDIEMFTNTGYCSD